MIKKLAVTLVALILFVVFQPHIKASVFEMRNAVALSRIDLEGSKKSELRQAISRVSTGLSQSTFTTVEKRTLREQLAKLRSHQGEELSVENADVILRRLETVLERYQL